MAGEVDDHIQIKPQYLPTGSISFGRFETETLSWERRSSFSHNRYLEEVEKYSTPGSVTQKKAYFEAHFKKKGGPCHQISSVSQCGSEGHTAQCVSDEQSNYMHEYDGQYNGDEPLHEFRNHANDGVQFCWYDESPVLSDGIKDEPVDGEGEEVTFTPQLTTDPIVPDVMTATDTNSQSGSCGKMDKTQEWDASLMTNDTIQTDVQLETANEEVADVASSFESKDALNLDSQVETDDTSHSKSATKSLKMEEVTLEQKTTKSTPKARSSAAQILQRSPSEKRSPSSVSSSRKIGRNTASGTPSKTRIEKQSDAGVSVPRKMKPKGSKNANANGGPENDSLKNGEKAHKLKRGVVIPESVPGRRPTSATGSSNRPNRVIDSVRSHLKTACTVFSFKSAERAEKRKEFHAKLEEKQHAKEAQMHGTPAKSQEEREARMKQFGRSHSFKATPMPSFYYENVAKGAIGKKAPAKSLTPKVSHRSPSNKITPRVSSPNISRADPGSTAERDSPAPESDSTDRLQLGSTDKPAELREAVKSKKIEVNKNDDRSKAKPVPSLGGGRVKKDERVSRTKSSSVAKAMRSNHTRACPAVHVVS